MALSHDRLAAIVAGAATLAERLAWVADDVAPAERGDDAGAEALVARWRSAVAGASGERWGRRLEWDGYEEGAVRRALSCRQPPASATAWSTLLADVVGEAACAMPDDAPSPQQAGDAPRAVNAFDEMLRPFLRVARRRIAANRERAGDKVSPSAHAELEQGLMQQLSAMAMRALYAEFTRFRTEESGGASTVLGSALRGGSTRWYTAFVKRHLDDNLASLFERYPVLARLLSLRTIFWVSNTAALLDRLMDDHAAIGAAFAGADLGATDTVVRVQPNLSDNHCGASSVAVLHFASGLRIVYKPRSLAVDRCMYRLLAFLNARHGGLALEGLTLVERADYGWVQFAVTAPCVNPAEVDRYFERGGMLLALSYVLGASDLHSGNVLACGEHPTLIDLEVVFNPLVDTGIPVERSGRRHAHETVLATALIPTRSTSGSVDFLDGGLLDRSAKQVYTRETLRYPNTDMMLWGSFEFVGGGRENVPLLEGVPASTRRHLGPLRRGFERMYDVLLAHRDELLAEGGPLRAFEGATVRVVHRPTSIYDRMASRTLHPRFLRHGAERSIEFERLKADSLVHASRPVLWNALAAEQRELEQGDVPVFFTRPITRTLWSGGGDSADDALIESGYEGVAERLRALGPDDRAQQLDLIRVAFAGADDYLLRLGERDVPPTADDESAAIQEGIHIGEALIGLRREGREASWLGLVASNANTSRLQPLDVGLFDGTAGIALFFAALGQCTGREEFRAVAEDCLRPIRRAVRDERQRRTLVERLGIGGAYGVGGLAYVFTRMASFSGDESYLDDARAAASAITEEHIRRDDRLDVMFGSAGAILSLLAVHRATSDVGVLRNAVTCGKHLLSRQLGGADRFGGHWPSGYGASETGFAHGTSGIVGALTRLAETGEFPAARDGIRAGLAALDDCYIPAKGNWRDTVVARSGAKDAEPWCSWCRGAAGIVLARLLLSPDDRQAAQPKIDAAIETATARDFPASDHVCCGTSGRIELLVAASQRLARPELLVAAREKSARIRAARVARGSYNTGYVTELSPGLFQGIAGIGYEMLRVARPSVVPSVLLWD